MLVVLLFQSLLAKEQLGYVRRHPLEHPQPHPDLHIQTEDPKQPEHPEQSENRLPNHSKSLDLSDWYHLPDCSYRPYRGEKILEKLAEKFDSYSFVYMVIRAFSMTGEEEVCSVSATFGWPDLGYIDADRSEKWRISKFFLRDLQVLRTFPQFHMSKHRRRARCGGPISSLAKF